MVWPHLVDKKHEHPRNPFGHLAILAETKYMSNKIKIWLRYSGLLKIRWQHKNQTETSQRDIKECFHVEETCVLKNWCTSLTKNKSTGVTGKKGVFHRSMLKFEWRCLGCLRCASEFFIWKFCHFACGAYQGSLWRFNLASFFFWCSSYQSIENTFGPY